MKGARLAGLIGIVYAVSHVAAYLAGSRAASFVHDLTFSYSAILAGLLIGAVGVFLSGLAATSQFVRKGSAPSNETADVLASIRLASRELRSNVLFALAMLGTQASIELLRLVDIPSVVWPFSASALSKGTVFNAAGIAAAALQFLAVFDCVRAMFTLSALAEEADSHAAPAGRSRTK